MQEPRTHIHAASFVMHRTDPPAALYLRNPRKWEIVWQQVQKSSKKIRASIPVLPCKLPALTNRCKQCSLQLWTSPSIKRALAAASKRGLALGTNHNLGTSGKGLQPASSWSTESLRNAIKKDKKIQYVYSHILYICIQYMYTCILFTLHRTMNM